MSSLGASSRAANLRAARVVFVNRYYRPDLSATSQMLTQLAEHLAEHGFNVAVVTTRGSYGAGGDDADRDVVAGVRVFRIGKKAVAHRNLIMRALQSAWLLIAFGVATARIARRGDLVIALTDPPLLGIVAWVAACLRGARVAHWLQDVFPEVAIALLHPGVSSVARLLLPARDLTLRRSDTLIAIGERMHAHLRSRVGDKTAIITIPNWADDEAITPAHAPVSGRIARGILPDVRLVVGYQGNLGRAHDGDSILEAATLLSKRPDIRFVLTGGGVGLARLRDDAASRGLGNITFRSYVSPDQLGESLCLPDIHLISLREEMEGLIVPSKLYSALSAGRGVVFLGDQGGEVARVLARAQAGGVSPSGDGVALAGLLAQLADAPERVMAWGTNARRHIDNDASRAQAFAHWRQSLTRILHPSEP
jgi:colanic acid biosynthesis glycosyl transferase WcaI